MIDVVWNKRASEEYPYTVSQVRKGDVSADYDVYETDDGDLLYISGETNVELWITQDDVFKPTAADLKGVKLKPTNLRLVMTVQ